MLILFAFLVCPIKKRLSHDNTFRKQIFRPKKFVVLKKKNKLIFMSIKNMIKIVVTSYYCSCNQNVLKNLKIL